MQVIIRFHDNEQQFDTYALDFKNFPLVKNHAHPYFVIVNALPKLQRHATSRMSASVMALYSKMVLIASRWEVKLERSLPPSGWGSAGGSVGRKRHKGGKKDQKGGGHTSGKTKAASTKGKGKNKQQDLERNVSRIQHALCPSSPNSPCLPVAKLPSIDHKMASSNWINGLAISEPPAEGVIPQNHEVASAPYDGDWHDWCFPWNRPSDRSKFSSNDHALDLRMFRFTKQPEVWSESDGDLSISDNYYSS